MASSVKYQVIGTNSSGVGNKPDKATCQSNLRPYDATNNSIQMDNGSSSMQHAPSSGNSSNNIINNNSNSNFNLNYNNNNINSSNTNNHSTNSTTVPGQRPLSRPASKTVELVKQRRRILEILRCPLCSGYIIDAVTIGECMDSFCRSCIVKHLESNSHCPKCGVLIHEVKPMSMIRPDKVLQDIIYKLVPGLYDREMCRRREFYLDSDSDDDPTTSSSKKYYGETYGRCVHPKPYFNIDDHINLSLEYRDSKATLQPDNVLHIPCTSSGNSADKPHSGLETNDTKTKEPVAKRYLRCPVMFTIMQLRRFISAKYALDNDIVVRLFHHQDPLMDEFTLLDVAYIYDWKGTETLKLYFSVSNQTLESPQSSTGTGSQANLSPSPLALAQTKQISRPNVSQILPPPAGFGPPMSSALSYTSMPSGVSYTPTLPAVALPALPPPPPPPSVSQSSSMIASTNGPNVSLPSSLPPMTFSTAPTMLATATSITSMARIPQAIHATTSYASTTITTSSQIHQHQSRIGTNLPYKQISTLASNPLRDFYTKTADVPSVHHQESSESRLSHLVPILPSTSEHSPRDYRKSNNSSHRPGLSAKSADASMAFSIVTEKGITIVRAGANKSFVNGSGITSQETARIERQQTTLVRNVPSDVSVVGRDAKRSKVDVLYH